MRCSNIEVTFKIPVPIDKPDGNNIIFSEKVVIDACKSANGSPILAYNEKGEKVPIGVASSVKYEDGYILLEGFTFDGGTDEMVVLDTDNKAMSMEIEGFGLCN